MLSAEVYGAMLTQVQEMKGGVLKNSGVTKATFAAKYRNEGTCLPVRQCYDESTARLSRIVPGKMGDCEARLVQVACRAVASENPFHRVPGGSLCGHPGFRARPTDSSAS